MTTWTEPTLDLDLGAPMTTPPVAETHNPTPDDPARARCPRCAGTNGNHGEVHVRHGNGGGHNEPCPNAPTPDDAARAEAERRYPEPRDVETGEPVDDWGYVECERGAYLRGRTDERAQIAARRDEAVRALADHRPTLYGGDAGCTCGVVPPQIIDLIEWHQGHVVDAVLAALWVSDRG